MLHLSGGNALKPILEKCGNFQVNFYRGSALNVEKQIYEIIRNKTSRNLKLFRKILNFYSGIDILKNGCIFGEN
jgi:hypothetical protein